MRERALVAVGVSAGVLCALWFSTVVAMGPAPGSIKSRGEAQRSQSKQPAPQPGPTAAKPKDQPPSAEDEAYCKGSQSRPDCIIQLRTARATERQADIAWIAFIAVAVTVAFTLGTVVAGFLTVWTMKTTAQRQLRAYVAAKPDNIEFNGNIPTVLHFTVTNKGQTPAYRLIIFNAFIFLPYPLPKSYDPGEPGDGETTNVLAQGDSLPCGRPLGNPITPAMQGQMRAGTHRWYSFVIVKYEDVFRRRFLRPKIRTTKMCASLPGDQMFAGMNAAKGTATSLKWEFDPNYNDAD